MSTYNEQLQKIWHQYEREKGQQPSSTRDAVEWGIRRGMLKAPSMDPVAKLSEDMATALRSEFRFDKYGRKYRVNHAVTITSGGVQLRLWSDMAHAQRPYMHKAFSQRRKQVVDDCVQLKTDVDVYNDMNPAQQPIPLVLNFTDDVAEAQSMKYGQTG
jgi:hypothetical protein